ncbi:MAG: thiopeptide-type bacteriocin biosynthesis protein [Tumebacillaceae bacterium]
MQTWLSLHAFHHDAAALDPFLLNGIAPLVQVLLKQGLIDSYFFIRYWEGGPHIRLRLRGDVNTLQQQVKPQATAALKEFLQANPSQTRLKRDTYYDSLFAHAPSGDADLPWYEDGEVLEIPYDQETLRYGGVQAMKVAQNLFMVSSEVTIALLGQYSGIEQKMAVGKDLMLLAMLALDTDEEQVRSYFERYASYYKVYGATPEQEDAFDRNCHESFKRQAAQLSLRAHQLCAIVRSKTMSALPGLYQTWLTYHQQTFAELRALHEQELLVNPLTGQPLSSTDASQDAIGLIAHSYAHMHNNRMGLNPYQESHLAYLLKTGLQADPSKKGSDLTCGFRFA